MNWASGFTAEVSGVGQDLRDLANQTTTAG
jgi:hypothetical protein